MSTIERAIKKIADMAYVARRNGYTQPAAIEFTIPELLALAIYLTPPETPCN